MMVRFDFVGCVRGGQDRHFYQEDIYEPRTWRKEGAKCISKRQQEAGLMRGNHGDKETPRTNEAP